MNNIYEIGFWVRITSDLEKEIEKVINLIEKFNGKIVEKGVFKKKDLAYPIDKENIGYFGYLLFSANKESIQEIKKELKFFKNILRFIIIKRRIKTQAQAANESK
ncbi:MAG: 30S ribosomal protein S6 [Minisyncoccia bacterium]